jgi:pyridinium-3,5-bisthiocarboxylic acid mononucleotide nickel chelatase
VSDAYDDRQSAAWFHCFAGIAGDMALASLVDAGADIGGVRELLERLPIRGWRLEVDEVLRGGINCTRVSVHAEDHVVVRTHRHIVGLITEARLPERVARRALAVFAALAEVEGRLHRRPPSQVHFHEVGGHDAIVDVVGTAAALEQLGVDHVRSSPIATGTGRIRTSHGMLPNPAPAVVELLIGAPLEGLAVPHELTTPTGAAILAALSTGYGPLPPMRVAASGFGAGHRDIEDLPNCTRVVIGVLESAAPERGQPVSVLETNVDDVTAEQLGLCVPALLDAGALDAWVTPNLMKKGRPGHTVHALCHPADVATLRDVLRDTTGTLGVRATSATRWTASRSTSTVTVDGQPVRIKVSARRAKPEVDDLVAAAARTGRSVEELRERALAAWRSGDGPRAEAQRPPDRPLPAG